MRSLHGGFTLLELMFAVAIVGILVALAVVAYTRNVRKARAGEVPQIFGELKMREEAWHSERGFYLAACPGVSGTPSDGDCTEGSYWPDPLPGGGAAMDATSPPDRWRSLRVNIPTGGLYCQYEVVAGKANVTTGMGEKGNILFTSTPVKNWYYLLARCDWDGDSDTKAMYWQRDDWSELGKENEGQ